jgi:hypothetical protein
VRMCQQARSQRAPRPPRAARPAAAGSFRFSYRPSRTRATAHQMHHTMIHHVVILLV